MQKVFCMYNLKKGVNVEAYKKWSREVDQKITSNQPGVISFQVYEIKGAEKSKVPYQIVEDIDVETWDVWQKVLKSEGMKKAVTEWGNYGDANSILMIYGDKI